MAKKTVDEALSELNAILRGEEAGGGAGTTSGSIATVAVPLGGQSPGVGGGSIDPWGNATDKKQREKVFRDVNMRLAANKAPKREAIEVVVFPDKKLVTGRKEELRLPSTSTNFQPQFGWFRGVDPVDDSDDFNFVRNSDPPLSDLPQEAMEPAEDDFPMLRRPFATEDVHHGVMLSMMIPEPAASALAHYAAGEHPPTADEMHVTLAYLGDAKQFSPAYVQKMIEALTGVLSRWSQLLHCKVGGTGKFQNADLGDGTAIYASIDCPGLEVLRQELVDALEAIGAPVSHKHGFTPHATLGYVKRESDPPPTLYRKIEWDQPTVSLVAAGNRIDIDVGIPTVPSGGVNEDFDYLFTCWPGKAEQLGPEMSLEKWLEQQDREKDVIESVVRLVLPDS